MKLRGYLKEDKIKEVKKEIAQLRKFQKRNKLTPLGKKKLEQLEEYLVRQGIFEGEENVKE